MKKDDISNKSLATLLIVALVVSIGGTWLVIDRAPGILQITGAPSTDTGTATVTIESTASVRFAVNAINFGTGKVNTTGGNTICILDSNGTNSSTQCINFTQQNGNLTLENDGSTNVTVQLVSNVAAAAFFGGTASLAQFRYAVQDNESMSCRNGTGGGSMAISSDAAGNCTAGGAAGGTLSNCTFSPQGWTDVNVTAPGSTICQKLLYNNTDDSIGIEVNLTIPFDAPAGTKTATFTATATTVT
ncbi:hypothetical protein HY492_00120 [Candidatus Woesearchaeota archaeon]|nr:hypothetical protein [Candidatus Woesearchaeota archaeon]